MSEDVKGIVKTASINNEKINKKNILEKMGVCIATQRALENRIRKLITALAI